MSHDKEEKEVAIAPTFHDYYQDTHIGIPKLNYFAREKDSSGSQMIEGNEIGHDEANADAPINGLVVNAVLAIGRPPSNPRDHITTDKYKAKNATATPKSLNYISGEEAYKLHVMNQQKMRSKYSSELPVSVATSNSSGTSSSLSSSSSSSLSSSSSYPLNVDRNGGIIVQSTDFIGRASSAISYASLVASNLLWNTTAKENGTSTRRRTSGFMSNSGSLGNKEEDEDDDDVDVDSPLFTHITMPFSMNPHYTEETSEILKRQEAKRAEIEAYREEVKRKEEEGG
jgi:hypothetical protein